MDIPTHAQQHDRLEVVDKKFLRHKLIRNMAKFTDGTLSTAAIYMIRYYHGGGTGLGPRLHVVGAGGYIGQSAQGIKLVAMVSGVTEDLRGVCSADGGIAVAVGAPSGGVGAAVIIETDNGTTWTADTSATGNGITLYDVATDGAGTWVAVGSPAAAAGPTVVKATVLDGTGGANWALVATTGLTVGETATGCCYFGGKYYICTSGGKILSSPTGVTWTSVYSLTTISFKGMNVNLGGEGYGLAAVGIDTAQYVFVISTDGTNFTRITITGESGTATLSVAGYKTLWGVACGSNHIRWTVDGGTTWTLAGAGGYLAVDVTHYTAIGVTKEHEPFGLADRECGHFWMVGSQTGKMIATPSI